MRRHTYEDIRCVYFALPGAMGEEEVAVTVSVGPHGARWHRYELYFDGAAERFGEDFPPFKEFGWDVFYQSGRLPEWSVVGISSGHYLLVRGMDAERLRQYSKLCMKRTERDMKQSFSRKWMTLIDYLVSTMPYTPEPDEAK